MRRSLTAIIAASVLVTGTATGEPATSSPKTQPAPHRIVPLTLELDDGRRWEIDKAMMINFRLLEAELERFQGGDLAAHRSLGARLQEILDQLVAGCTMQGAAHDQLHEWLVPFMGEVRLLAGAADLNDSKRRLQLLKESFEVFHDYFR